MIGMSLAVIKGVSGKLLTLRQKIVTTGTLNSDSCLLAGLADYRQLPIQIVIFFAHQKGEIQIA